MTFWVYQDPVDSNWHKEDDPAKTYTDGLSPGKMTEQSSGTQFFIIADNQQREILVLFDEYGNIQGYGQPTTAGPITGSCWASVDPAAYRQGP